ncbi:MAG: class I SAM-dependent methyltransferase [Cellulosilyticaceae bacterium]
MKEIEINKEAWSLVSKDHYETFLKRYNEGTYDLNKTILSELGDIKGKKIIHLQCNTGADSIRLAQLGAIVTGVDLVPDNIYYAEKLSKELGVENITFITSDIMKLCEIHNEKYDIVFTSEGAIGWLPNLTKWGQTIRELLKNDGFFYVFDSHPFYLSMDEEKFSQGRLEVKYPYFKTQPDVDDTIGGYASETKKHTNYFWMYTVSKLVNSLVQSGLHIEFFNEYTDYMCDLGNMKLNEKQLYSYEFNSDKFPMSFSLKASVYRQA